MFSLLIHQMTFRAIKAISNLLIFRLEQWAMPDDKMLPNLSNYVLKIKLICFVSLLEGLFLVSSRVLNLPSSYTLKSLGGGRGLGICWLNFLLLFIQFIAINNQNVSFLHNSHIFLFLETRGSIDYVTTKEGGLNFCFLALYV